MNVMQRCQPKTIEICETANFASRSTLLNHQNGEKPQKPVKVNTSFKHFPSNPGDLVIRTGDGEMGRFGLYLGDSWIIRQSQHRWWRTLGKKKSEKSNISGLDF